MKPHAKARRREEEIKKKNRFQSPQFLRDFAPSRETSSTLATYAPSHAIRNRLLRLTADSPDLLAIIEQEGKV